MAITTRMSFRITSHNHLSEYYSVFWLPLKLLDSQKCNFLITDHFFKKVNILFSFSCVFFDCDYNYWIINIHNLKWQEAQFYDVTSICNWDYFKFWITKSCDGDKRLFHCRTRKNAPVGAKNINEGRIQGLVGWSQPSLLSPSDLWHGGFFIFCYLSDP